MPRAIWNDAVIAESTACHTVEGNTYFPPEALKADYFRPSDHHSTCGWKGEASYYHVEVNGKTNANAAWFYPTPKAAAAEITGYVAFWKGVQIEP